MWAKVCRATLIVLGQLLQAGGITFAVWKVSIRSANVNFDQSEGDGNTGKPNMNHFPSS